MAYSDDDLNEIHDKTDGRCHICRKKLAFTNYGRPGQRGAWEVDHSVPRAAGGTDRWHNLLPACISCNRSKQHGSTRAARSTYGYTSRPKSRAQRQDALVGRAIAGGVSFAAVGATLAGPPGAFLGVLLGLVVGSSINGAD